MARNKNQDATQTDQPQSNGADQPTPTAFVLQPNRWAKISSKIYTMKLDTANGEKDVPKEYLVDTTDKKNPRYRFQTSVGVPMINPAAITDRDSLLTELGAFVDALTEYDAADGLSNEAIKKDGTETKIIPRRINLCVNGKGEAIAPIEYVRRLLVEANTLSVQKQLQKPLRDSAETQLWDQLSTDLGWVAPAGKTKREKAVITPTDAADAFDTL